MMGHQHVAVQHTGLSLGKKAMAKNSAFPFMDMDLTKMMADFKVPGVDVEALLASQRKNIEAVTAANQLAIEGMQAVLRRQAEIMRQTMEEATSMFTEAMSVGAPEDKVAKQADLIKTAFEKTLANMREMAEMVAKSNTEAAEVLSKRVSESLDELKGAVGKARK